MDLRRLSNQELWEETQKLVAEERKITTAVLWHLQEVSRRRLYLDRGFPNLFAYCTEGLGYTPGAASRRIKAMQLLRSLPEANQKQMETSLNEGKVSLSNVSALQYFFEKEKKHCEREFSQSEKIDLLQQIEGKTQEECQKLLFSVSLAPEKTLLPQERERVVSQNNTEVKFTASDALLKKLRRIRELVAHRNPNPTYSELFDLMAEIVLKKIDPEKKELRLKNPSDSLRSAAEWRETTVMVSSPESKMTLPALIPASPAPLKPHPIPLKKSRLPVPRSIQREVYKRDGGECTYTDPVTHRKCGSRFGLELDHLIPVACGGENTVENLRIRCRQHNWLEAKRIFGQEKMEVYLRTK